MLESTRTSLARRRLRRFWKTLSIEALETKLCLTTMAFVETEFAESTQVLGWDAGDLDADNDMDIVIATQAGITLYQYVDSDGSFTASSLVENDGTELIANLDGIHGFDSWIKLVDLDGDNELDILVGVYRGEKFPTPDKGSLYWHKNLGNLEFSDAREIGNDYFSSATMFDREGDGDLDLLATWYLESWLKPGLDEPRGRWFDFGDGSFSPGPNFTVVHPHVTDFDEDGDLDLLAFRIPFNGEPDVVWYDNIQREGRVLATESTGIMNIGGIFQFVPTFEIRTPDFDGDGDKDVIAFAPAPNGARIELAIRNDDGSFAQTGVASRGELGRSGDAVDVDGDGDTDLLWYTKNAPYAGGSTSVLWFESLAGSIVHSAELKPNCGSPLCPDGRSYETLLETPVLVELILPVDIDGDGDIDFLSSSRTFQQEIKLFENRLIGDVDNDGEVAFADFMALAENFGKEVDAVWEQGDFDSNGKVDFTDFLVLAENFGAKRPVGAP